MTEKGVPDAQVMLKLWETEGGISVEQRVYGRKDLQLMGLADYIVSLSESQQLKTRHILKVIRFYVKLLVKKKQAGLRYNIFDLFKRERKRT